MINDDLQGDTGFVPLTRLWRSKIRVKTWFCCQIWPSIVYRISFLHICSWDLCFKIKLYYCPQSFGIRPRTNWAVFSLSQQGIKWGKTPSRICKTTPNSNTERNLTEARKIKPSLKVLSHFPVTNGAWIASTVCRLSAKKTPKLRLTANTEWVSRLPGIKIVLFL